MTRIFLTIALALSVAAGCDSTDTGNDGGTGGAGGTIGPLTWTTPSKTIVGDDCDFFVADESLTFEITIQGSTVTLADADPNSSLMATTDDYTPTDNEVLLTGAVVNENFPPCKASLEDAFSLMLDDPDLSLDENATLTVTWDHVEDDVSDVAGDCEGEWFVPLPCAGEATLTLTQEPAP